MKSGIQSFFKTVGDEACLILCMIELAERETGEVFNPIDVINDAIKERWIQQDMYVEQPTAIMHFLCGGKWEYRYSARPGGPDELTIERWERKSTNGTVNHFRLADWDSLTDSQTVKYGHIASYRILKKTA